MTSATAAERRTRLRTAALLIPAALLMICVFAIPFAFLVASAFSAGQPGEVGIGGSFSTAGFSELFGLALYRDALLQSLYIAVVTATLSWVLGYPVAYVIANSRSVRAVSVITILLLIPFQLTAAVRVFGLVALLGNNGLINGPLVRHHVISGPLPLMYNHLGIFIGTIEFTLPFAVFSLVGVLRTISHSMVEAGRSLGASYWRTFRRVVFPLSLPGIVAAFLVAFALTISDYIIPDLMSAYHVQVLPSLMDQQILDLANYPFAAALGVTLVVLSLVAVGAIYLMIRRIGRMAWQ